MLSDRNLGLLFILSKLIFYLFVWSQLVFGKQLNAELYIKQQHQQQ